ncbi:Transcriptional regulator, LysR family [Bordetella tumbae]|uniref:LysR substrate-binding domain-containing protein n=1 Tax=Bordetella tumbae TaxID=1649139 RepID=UPI0039EE39D0
MRRRLPPLTTLRPFEATARLGSFTQAARELSLTQGAVSQQVRNLEDFLGVRLFERHARRLDLSEAGRQFYASARRALDDLERSTARIVARGARETVTLTTMPTLATVWLMPRLSSFTSLHPDIDLRLMTSIEPADLHAGGVDVAIRVGKLPGRSYRRDRAHIDLVMTERWDGIVADPLFPDALVPVASQALLAAGPPIATAADVLQYPLIHTVSRQRAWQDWFQAHGLAFHPRADAPEFGHFFISMQAALEGMGIALVPELIYHYARQQSTNLTAAWLPAVRSAGEYYVLTHESQDTSPAVQAVRQWLGEQAGATRAQHGLDDSV